VIAPEWVAVSGFGRRRSLSDLAVWGFPEIFPENLPPQALLSPFSPHFLSLDLSSNSSSSQTPPFNSLAQTFISPCYPPTLLVLLQTLSYPLKSPIGSPPNTSGIPPYGPKSPQKSLKGPF